MTAITIGTAAVLPSLAPENRGQPYDQRRFRRPGNCEVVGELGVQGLNEFALKAVGVKDADSAISVGGQVVKMVLVTEVPRARHGRSLPHGGSDGRVGEEAKPSTRLSPRRTGRAGFPHPALAETLASSMHRSSPVRSQGDQAQLFHLSVDRHTFWGPIVTLATAPQMFPQAPVHVAVDLIEGVPRIAETEVVAPASQVPIQLPDQLGDRDAVLLRISHLAQLRPLPRQGFLGRNHVQVTMPPPLGARSVVPKRES